MVGGNTTLTGAAITSTDAAFTQQRNQFSTAGTLSTTDIDNQARHTAEAVSVNLGTGMSSLGKLAPAGTAAGLGQDSASEASTTQAAISGVAGNRHARTGEKETGIAPLFDAGTVQREIAAQTQITQVFGQLAPMAVADFAHSRSQTLLDQAEQASDPDQRAALLKDAQQWGEGGGYRVALHAAAGGLTGGLQGALGAGAAAAVTPALADAIAQLAVPEPARQALTLMTGTAVGAATGGAAGAAGAFNQTANNFLLHQEARQREAARQKLLHCQDDACRREASDEVKHWDQLDQWRDKQIETACQTPASVTCQGWHLAIQAAQSGYREYDAKQDQTLSVANERSQVNQHAFMVGQRVQNPALFGVAKGLLKLSPPGLIAGVGASTYAVTTAILEHGLVDVAISIARGVQDLPGDMQARLNSVDPAVRGEALVDVLAVGSVAPYVSAKLVQGGGAKAAGKVGSGVRADTTVRFSRLVDGGGLAVHEVAGGHLLQRHVGKSADQLLDRLATDPKIAGSSSFYNRVTAESAIAQTLDANQAQINKWLRGSQRDLKIESTLSENIGVTISKGSTNALDTPSLRLILRRDSTMSNGYRIQTGFPTR